MSKTAERRAESRLAKAHEAIKGVGRLANNKKEYTSEEFDHFVSTLMEDVRAIQSIFEKIKTEMALIEAAKKAAGAMDASLKRARNKQVSRAVLIKHLEVLVKILGDVVHRSVGEIYVGGVDPNSRMMLMATALRVVATPKGLRDFRAQVNRQGIWQREMGQKASLQVNFHEDRRRAAWMYSFRTIAAKPTGAAE